MSEIKDVTVVDAHPIPEYAPMEKFGAGTEVETIQLSPESSVEGDNAARSSCSEQLSTHNNSESGNHNNTVSNASSKPPGEEKGEDRPHGEAKPGEDLTLLQLYEKLSKKVQSMEKTLEKGSGFVFDDSEKQATENTEACQEDQGNVEEAEQPFSLEQQIKYVRSDKWCSEDVRDFWLKPVPGAHTLIVSKKSLGNNTIHSPPAPEVSKTGQIDILKPGIDDESDTAKGKVDRLAIVCPTLLAEVCTITGTKLTKDCNVIVPPFKTLISFYNEFSDCLRENDALCGRLLEEQDAKQQSALNPSSGGSEEEMKDDVEATMHESKLTQVKSAQKIANGMKCLLQFMDNELHDIIEVHRHIRERTLREIAFEHLWHLFKPGDLVVSNQPKDQAYRVLSTGGGRLPRDTTDCNGNLTVTNALRTPSDFFLDCYYIDFNGVHYGPVPKQITIAPYEGLRPVTALEVIPISLIHEQNGSQLEAALQARGKKFMKLARVSHKKYKGLSLREGNFRHEEVEGDAIIDFALAFKNSTRPYEIEPPMIGGGVIEDPTRADVKETREALQQCPIIGCCETVYVYDDTKFDISRRTKFIESPTTNLSVVPVDKAKLGPERLVLLPYRVYGYVLLSRKWYPLDIDLVEDVKQTERNSPDGFSDLVLPEDHKHIVRALVKTHARGTRSTSSNKSEDMFPSREVDLVKGKGKGLVILLHGVPGVGKTSTAECVAANTNRPLFPITCGDIGGTTAKEVETNLESYFDLARKWGCVLLLDEADVFLGERTKGDFVQNSLVSVFLRVLEYYSGILILTTNRVGQFDEAIKSRIHISLYYPPLDKNTSLKIWETNLDRLERRDDKLSPNRRINFGRKEIMKFAKGHWKDNEASKTNWNGRQIKNAFQTAIALAEWDFIEFQSDRKLESGLDGPFLEAHHFRKVAETSARFEQYLTSVRNSDMQNAKTKNNRKDDFVDTGIATEAGLRYPSLQETRTANRARRAVMTRPDSEDDQDDSSSGESTSYLSEEDSKAKKYALMRSQREEGKRKKDEAERITKKKQKEAQRQQKRDQEEAKRKELQKSREREEKHHSGSNSDSDLSA